MITEGFIRLWRDIKETSLYRNRNAKELFIHFLLSVSYKEFKYPTRDGDIDIKKGMYITSVNKISEEIGMSVQSVRTAIDYLLLTNKITSKSTNKYTIVQVQNWDKHQNGNKQTNKQTNKQQTNKQQTNNKQTTTKEESKELKKNKETKEKDTHANAKALTTMPSKIDYQFFLKTWNENLTPRIRTLSEERKNWIRTRIARDSDFTKHFEICMNEIKESNFLSGDSESGWRATFDWLIQNGKNYIKVLEGNYEKKQTKGSEKNEQEAREFRFGQ